MRSAALWYLQRFHMLDALSDEQKRELVATTTMSQLKRRQRIYLPGDPSDQIFLLKSGIVKIAVVGPDGRDAILAFLQPGDIFGEMAAADVRLKKPDELARVG